MSTCIVLDTEKEQSNQLIDEDIVKQLLDQLKKEKNDEHDRLVGEFFNHCLKKYNEKKPEYMLLVAVLLPNFVSDSYESPVTNFMKRITYVKFPSEFLHKQKFPSTCEHIWSYKFPNTSFLIPN